MAAAQNPPNNSYFPLVDVLRGMAALGVVTLHVIHHSNWHSFPSSGPISWLRYGDEGVDLFFVISGFVVLYNALSIIDRYGHSWNFYTIFSIRRVARIFPLYFFTLFIYLILVDDNKLIPRPEMLFHHLIAHSLFVHNLFTDTFSSINGVNWTIALEIQFYIVIALISPFLFAKRNRIFLFFGPSLIVAILWRYLAFADYSGHSDDLSNYYLFVRSAQLPGVIDEFASGMLLAIFVRALTSARSRWHPGFFLFAAMFLLYVAHTDLSLIVAPSLQSATRKTFLAFGFLSVLAAACTSKSPMITKITLPLQYIGKISYGIYLYHLIVIMLIKGQMSLPPHIFFCAALFFTILVSTLSWHFFENPILQRTRAWERQRFQNAGTQPAVALSP